MCERQLLLELKLAVKLLEEQCADGAFLPQASRSSGDSAGGSGTRAVAGAAAGVPNSVDRGARTASARRAVAALTANFPTPRRRSTAPA